jgi:hypothetical protein
MFFIASLLINEAASVKRRISPFDILTLSFWTMVFPRFSLKSNIGFHDLKTFQPFRPSALDRRKRLLNRSSDNPKRYFDFFRGASADHGKEGMPIVFERGEGFQPGEKIGDHRVEEIGGGAKEKGGPEDNQENGSQDFVQPFPEISE